MISLLFSSRTSHTNATPYWPQSHCLVGKYNSGHLDRQLSRKDTKDHRQSLLHPTLRHDTAGPEPIRVHQHDGSGLSYRRAEARHSVRVQCEGDEREEKEHLEHVSYKYNTRSW